MALKPRLYPNRANLLPKMLLGIADDCLRHCLIQGIVRFIVDRNVSHGDAPQSCGMVEAVRLARGASPLHGARDAGAPTASFISDTCCLARSEERRVGNECRSGW